MKEFNIKVFNIQEAFTETVKSLKADESIQEDEYFQELIKKCDALDASDVSCLDDIANILTEMVWNRDAVFKLVPDEMREELQLDDSPWYIETHWFD